MGSTTGSIIITKSGKQVTAGATAPAAPKLHELWIDTGNNTNILKYWDGTSWITTNDVSDEFSDIYETLQTNYYTKKETDTQVSSQIGAATITKADGTVVNMKDALNNVIDTASSHSQTISSLETSFENLEIGGRNLIPHKAKFWEQGTIDNAGNHVETDKRLRTKDYHKIEGGEYILNRFTDGFVVIFYYDSEKNILGNTGWITSFPKSIVFPAETKYARYVISYEDWNTIIMQNDTVTVFKFKLEKGNKVTDWTYANEDLDNSDDINEVNTTLTNKYNTLEQNLNKFEINVGETYATQTALDGKKDTVYATFNGGGKANLYCHLAQIQIKEKYINTPLVIGIIQRGYGYSQCIITFTSASDTNPNISSIKKTGQPEWYIYKSSAGIFDLYVKKYEPWDNLSVIEYENHFVTDNSIIVTWVCENADAVSGWTTSEQLAAQYGVDNTSGGTNGSTNLITSGAVNAGITITKNSIMSEVSDTYTTKTDFENLEIGATNILRNYSKYTEDNKLKVTANKDNYTAITSARVTLKEGKQYTFSCKTDGIWGTGLDDTVEAYLLLDGKYDTFLRMNTNEGFTFTAPASGEYYLRVDVNKNGMTHYFWNFKIEEGNKTTTWSPCPNDVDSQITSISTIATQTADKFNWLVKSGTSSSDFTITDRLASLTSEKLNIDALTTFMNHAKDGSSTVINGSAITSGYLQSANYSEAVGTLNPLSGSKLNLEDGSFKSINLKWDSNGNVTANNLKATNGNFSGKVNADTGKIGNWEITSVGGLKSDTNTGTTPGTMNRIYLQPFSKENYEDTWLISSQYFNIDSSGNVNDTGHPYWYITGIGDMYTMGDITASRFHCDSSTYPQIYGNGTYLGLAAKNDNNVTLFIDQTTNSFRPSTNGSHFVGLPSIPFSSYYTAGSYNTTSDRNKKNSITDLDAAKAEAVIMSLNPVSFKFNDSAYDRHHWGFIAQDVEDKLNKLGIDWQEYAVVDRAIHQEQVFEDVLDEEGNVTLNESGNPVQEMKMINTDSYDYYLRYEAFIAPLVKTIQIQQHRINEQQEEIDNLLKNIKEQEQHQQNELNQQQNEIEELKTLITELSAKIDTLTN